MPGSVSVGTSAKVSYSDRYSPDTASMRSSPSSICPTTPPQAEAGVDLAPAGAGEQATVVDIHDVLQVDADLGRDAAGQRAVHDEVGAADPAGHGAGEKDHGSGDLFGSAHVAGRVERDRRLEQVGLPVSMLAHTPPSKYVLPGETVLARMPLSASCSASPWM